MGLHWEAHFDCCVKNGLREGNWGRETNYETNLVQGRDEWCLEAVEQERKRWLFRCYLEDEINISGDQTLEKKRQSRERDKE